LSQTPLRSLLAFPDHLAGFRERKEATKEQLGNSWAEKGEGNGRKKEEGVGHPEHNSKAERWKIH